MQTISNTIYQQCQTRPDLLAVRLLYSQASDQEVSYRDFWQGSIDYAQAVQQSGVQPGEVVIIILPHSDDLLFAFFGAILAGAVPSIMPFLTEKLSPDHYRESLASLFAICKPGAVITYEEFVADVKNASQGCPSVRSILVNHQVPKNVAVNPIQSYLINSSPQDTAFLQHSSGTTGLQKGVALSHQAVFNQLDSYTEAIRLNQNDVIVSWLPLYHDMGLIAGFLMPLLKGIPLVLMSPFDWVRAPYRLMQAISKHRGTLCWLPNFAYNFCASKIRDREMEGIDLSSLRAVINCSEPMFWQSHEMFRKRFTPYGFQTSALATCYAMAETVFAVTQGGIDSPVTIDQVNSAAILKNQFAEPSLDPSDAISMVSAGFPIKNTQVKIVDTNGQSLPDRRLGEIAILSDCMLTGYHERPDLTQKAFLNGWYLSGDLGYIANGEIYITGRKKDLIIVGGKNVYPQDLERIASEVEGVHPGRTVAFGVHNPEAGTEDVVIVAEVDQPDKEAREAIAHQVRLRVNKGSDIALRFVHVVERGWLLKTSSGKIARSANRDKYLQERGSP